MSDIEWIYSDDGRVRQPAIGWDAYDKLTADRPAPTDATAPYQPVYTAREIEAEVCEVKYANDPTGSPYDIEDAHDPPITAAELEGAIYMAGTPGVLTPDEIFISRLAITLRSERAERDADARIIAKFARLRPPTMLDWGKQDVDRIDAAKERAKR